MPPAPRKRLTGLRRYRRVRGRPQRGWALVAEGAERLGIWEGMLGYAIQRSFALIIKEIPPLKRIAKYLRPENFIDGALHIRAMSSMVVTEFHFIKDIVLTHLNNKLELANKQIASADEEKRKSFAKFPPVKSFVFSVGPLAGLPDWSEPVEKRRPRSRVPARPDQPVAVDVVAELGRLENPELREALGKLYASVTAPEPRPRSRSTSE